MGRIILNSWLHISLDPRAQAHGNAMGVFLFSRRPSRSEHADEVAGRLRLEAEIHMVNDGLALRAIGGVLKAQCALCGKSIIKLCFDRTGR